MGSRLNVLLRSAPMSCRIFLSYGHDEHAALARKLKSDLEARGHAVWFDEERLSPGEDWEHCIERGIDWACAEPGRGRIVLLLTPHAVRRPDGYCLNEVARALSRGLRVLPVMVMWCEPPLSICRIQWLDLRDCVPVDTRAAAYAAKLELLITALSRDHLDFEGGQARLLALLDPLPFEAEISEHLARFTGRQWIFDAIDAWLADRGADKVFWITGPPGVGKTALASRLLATRPEIVAVHLCRFGHMQKADPRRAVMSIAYQLATQLPEYEARLNSLHLERIIPESDARTLFDRLIVQPLSANYPDPGRTLVILIDALDEASQDGSNQLALFLAAEFARTPAWLRLVITSRPDPEVMYPLQAITAHVLDASSSDNIADLRIFLQRELKSHLLDVRNANVVVETIIARSEGSFLYAEWLRKEILSGRMSLKEAEGFPQGLGGVYSQFVDRQWSDISHFKSQIAPALDVIAAAREPLPTALLARLFAWTDRQFNDFTQSLGSLFAATEGRIVPFHKSLLDWLTDRAKAGPYFISAADGGRRLAEACARELRSDGRGMPDYTRRHALAHLTSDRRWEDLEWALTNLPFLEVRAEAGEVFSLAADFAAATAALPEERPLSRLLRLLQQALRREFHFIARHPTTLFQCLWNQCWWFDSAEAAVHLSPPKGGWDKDLPPWQQAGPKLHKLLEGWRKDKEARMPGFLWVRSLRPPAMPLGNSHMVLGGHTDTINSVVVSADGSRLVSSGDDGNVRLWDTTTGEPLREWRPVNYGVKCSLSPDGRHVVATSVKGILIHWDALTGRKIGEIGPVEQGITCVAISPDSRLVAVGTTQGKIHIWELDGAHEVASWQAYKRKIDWGDFKVGALAFSPDGRRLASGGGWGCEDFRVKLWDWRNGQELVSHSRHRTLVHGIAFSPDGTKLASCSGDVAWWALTLSDVETGSLLREFNGHSASIDDVGFSPDGRKLVSGSWDETIRLWDASSGLQLGAVSIGNQVNCASFLADGRIYSAGYDEVVRIWDELDLAVPPPVRPDFADNIWRLAYSPDGQFLVAGSERGELWFWDGNTGRLLGQPQYRVRGPVNNLVFSPDGRQLAVATGSVPWEFDDDAPWRGIADFDIRIYDPSTRQLLSNLSGLTSKVAPRKLRYFPDGSAIMAPLDAGPVAVWNAKTFARDDDLVGELAVKWQKMSDNNEAPPSRVFAVRQEGPETIIVDVARGREAGWFAIPLYALTRHPGDRIWAGRTDEVNADQHDARRLEMFCIEGSLL